MTPGQAAYEAFSEQFPGEAWGYSWEQICALPMGEQAAWEKIGQAAARAEEDS
jgi:hypothetical protein